MMGRRKFDRTVVKKCPICGQQIPVACRYCSCGHQFTSRVRSSSSTSSIPDEREADQSTSQTEEGDKRRRTVRTKRVKPDFFNSLELDYSSRQMKHKKVKEIETKKKGRGRPKGSVNKPKTPDTTNPPTPLIPTEPVPKPPVEEDVFSGVSLEKLRTYDIILSELNRKMMTTSAFNPT
ncbi:hypothetical protein LOTGIDRAFT_235567 [Lottia gigantea]|uniref:UPF0547 domain-containing protein n=1 Tax=Lottia gigantea TaxID=225164 RepID=V3ZTT3_LOTGI|nr:hypothetical protein LOTGIDRAFT_235567 [Lottia gigantea]ESO85965.1 hypothetical protein LOTGIDRAFT_235567 [Lottia gigantea]